jgi:transposase
MAKKGQKFGSFSQEFKLKAVKMYHEEHKGVETIAKELGLPSHSYVRRWLKAYAEKGPEGLKDQRSMPAKEGKKRGRPPKANSLEEENLRLRAENEYLKKLLLQEGWDVPKR